MCIAVNNIEDTRSELNRVVNALEEDFEERLVGFVVPALMIL
jgi:hypothetical protein